MVSPGFLCTCVCVCVISLPPPFPLSHSLFTTLDTSHPRLSPSPLLLLLTSLNRWSVFCPSGSSFSFSPSTRVECSVSSFHATVILPPLTASLPAHLTCSGSIQSRLHNQPQRHSGPPLHTTTTTTTPLSCHPILLTSMPLFFPPLIHWIWINRQA